MDYKETFAPVAKMTTVQVLIALSSICNWTMFQMDMNNAFLHCHLKELVYMRPASGYSTDGFMVCKLKKLLYWLKQAPRA